MGRMCVSIVQESQEKFRGDGVTEAGDCLNGSGVDCDFLGRVRQPAAILYVSDAQEPVLLSYHPALQHLKENEGHVK